MKTIEVSEETYERIKDQLRDDEAIDISGLDDLVGRSVLIRTVTHYYTGKVYSVVGNFVVLNDAAWIASTGRFSDAIKNGSLSEVEPIGNGVMVSLAAAVDIIPWRHKLPKDQK